MVGSRQSGEGLEHGTERDVVGDDVLDRAARRLARLGESSVGHDALLSPDHPQRLVAGRRRQPGGEAVGLTDPAAVLGQAQPHGLHDVVGRRRREAERPGDRPHEAGEALDELVPRRFVAIDDARQQRRRCRTPPRRSLDQGDRGWRNRGHAYQESADRPRDTSTRRIGVAQAPRAMNAAAVGSATSWVIVAAASAAAGSAPAIELHGGGGPSPSPTRRRRSASAERSRWPRRAW